MRACRTCGESKSPDDYYAKGSRLFPDCKVCVLADRAERYRSDPAMRQRIIAHANSRRPPTKPRSCSRCGARMQLGSRTGEPGVCKACKRLMGHKIEVTRQQRAEIYARDGWVCWLCEQPVDPELAPNDRMAATLDHVQPRSATLFPDDSPANLRLAHRACNSARGARAA